MKLEKYLLLNKISERKFAASISVSQAHISNIIRGRKNPSLSLAKRIEEATYGKVMAYDLLHPEVPTRLKNKDFNNEKT